MNYKESLDYLEQKSSLGIVPGLAVVLDLLHELGNPERKVPALHIAGTNGKGSIMSFVESAMIEAGLKVGRYISPALKDYRERWTVNREMPSEEEVASLMPRIREAESRIAGTPTAFETDTAFAFLWFAEEKCDVMLIECGMGGRLDATNVLPKKVVDVLATVSMDHMQFLGDTREKILTEKLGIVKPGDALVTSPMDRGLADCMTNYLRENVPEHECYITALSCVSGVKRSLKGTTFSLNQKEYRISMSGQVALENAVTALMVLEIYNKRAKSFGLPVVSEEAISRGLTKTVWPGRFMVTGSNPVVILDGAHNRDAWKRLREELEYFFPEKGITFVMGVLRDKEVDCMLDTLLPLAKKLYTFTPDSPRGMKSRTLSRKAEAWMVVHEQVTHGQELHGEEHYGEKLHVKMPLKNEIYGNERNVTGENESDEGKTVTSCRTVLTAAKRAIREAGREDVVVIAGSLSFMGELLSHMEVLEKRL